MNIILPVGKSLGPLYESESASDGPEGYDVSVADEVETLTRDEYTVWSALWLDPDRALLRAWDRAVLAEVARGKGGVAEPGPAIDRLFEVRLLTCLHADDDDTSDLPESWMTLLRGHRLIPTGDALGNTAEDPDRYLIGRDGRALVTVLHQVYALWSYSHNIGTMWEGCVDYTGPPDDGSPRNLTLEQAAGNLADSLPLLIVHRLAYLELPV